MARLRAFIPVWLLSAFVVACVLVGIQFQGGVQVAAQPRRPAATVSLVGAPSAAGASALQGGQGQQQPQQRGGAATDAHNRSLHGNNESLATGAQQAALGAQGGGVLTANASALFVQHGKKSAKGVPLSSHTCLFDDGTPEHRLCVFSDLLAHDGRLYYVTEEGINASMPSIQVAWQDWVLEPALLGDKLFAPQLVAPAQLHFPWDPAQVEVVERAWLPHQVEPGNFYHSVGEVLPSLFANWCTFVGACRFQDRGAAGFEVLLIQPDPHKYGMSTPVREAWQCLSERPLRKLSDLRGGKPLHIRHGVVGIGPYLRAYERQPFMKSWSPPPPQVLTQWRRYLLECMGLAPEDPPLPRDPLRLTVINRPWSAGRSFLNLHETLQWLGEWLPQQQPPARVEVSSSILDERQGLRAQLDLVRGTSLLIYPHGATMALAAFLPQGGVALEVIPWPNVTEPHGWLQSIKRQFGLEEVRLLLMVNEHRDHLILNLQALKQDPDYMGLSAEEKVALQERGACPKQHEPKCMFVWLHWRAELVLNHHQLAGKLAEALAMLRAAGTLPDSGGGSQGGGAAATA